MYPGSNSGSSAQKACVIADAPRPLDSGTKAREICSKNTSVTVASVIVCYFFFSKDQQWVCTSHGHSCDCQTLLCAVKAGTCGGKPAIGEIHLRSVFSGGPEVK
ncbi:hypothetical protein EVAR_96026_1 [Eumeta japonica]|uniref:Uncharacterized protein n=1 Tax=Eumeta variegata TaxID=151549 RepID=A0A4C1XD19_EUMVA|nr:hypothetical protein EVAR_96026_1 [Eumeta japonica]